MGEGHNTYVRTDRRKIGGELLKKRKYRDTVRLNQINDGEYSLGVCLVQEYSRIFSYLDISGRLSLVGVNNSHPHMSQ